MVFGKKLVFAFGWIKSEAVRCSIVDPFNQNLHTLTKIPQRQPNNILSQKVHELHPSRDDLEVLAQDHVVSIVIFQEWPHELNFVGCNDSLQVKPTFETYLFLVDAENTPQSTDVFPWTSVKPTLENSVVLLCHLFWD